MTPKILVDHSRGTKREGISVIAIALLTSGGLVGFFHLFCHFVVNLRNESPVFYFVFNGFALIFGGFLIFAVGVPNLLMKRRFRFVVSEDRIECQSPAKAFGESYSIPIDDIASLQEHTYHGDTQWWFITCDNRRIEITPNYGNPVREIVAALRQLRPELPVQRK